ncbi:MAG: cytochrome P450 [Dehalococcoidia bacterium]
MAVADHHPLSPDVLECPFPFYKELHAEAPVYFPPGVPMAMVSTYELIQEVVHDPATYSSAIPTGPVDLVRSDEDLDPELRELRREALKQPATLLSADPPWHSRYRSIVNKAFAARRVNGMEGYVREIVTNVIDEFIDDGKVELVTQFADTLPMAVIADQIGVPRDQLKEFKARSDVAIGGIDTQTPPDQELAKARAAIELQRYFIARAEDRRKEPKDDMLTVLATSMLETDDGPRLLNDGEILSILQQFQVAGKETTAHSIGMTMQLLVQNPEQMARVKADPSLIPNLIEEGLRVETPVRALFRVTTKETVLGGVPLNKGQVLMLVFAAANRDENEFADSGAFDVCRDNAKSHLAFSAGPHYCVGSALARLELRVAFEELTRRLDNIRVDPAYNQNPPHTPSYILRGLKELHLLFDKAPV